MADALRLKAWSHARLSTFEQCRYQAKLRFVDRIPEQYSEVREEIIQRGEALHLAAEKYVRGELAELPPELGALANEFTALRDAYKLGGVELEAEWGFGPNWEIVDWRYATCRVKADAFVRTSPHTATLIDYKTGKRVGKEIKHGEQMQLYCVAAFLRYPELEEIVVELWYPDVNLIVPMTFSRRQGLKLLPSFERRAKALLECTDFRPNPNVWSCRYCPYSIKAGNGKCGFGI